MGFIAIRKRVLELDPTIQLQKKHPAQLWAGAFWLAVAVSLIVLNLNQEFSLPVKILSSLIIGLSLSILTFFNHEILHGSIVPMKLAQVLAYPGFFVFSLSPELWKTWHNHLHHYNANKPGGLDPDLAGDWNRLKNRKIGRLLVKLLPGSGHPASYLFNCIAFSAQSANVTWLRSREEPGFYKTMNRKRVVVETLVYYALWIAAFALLPFSQFFFLLMIPTAIVNNVVFNYVGLPHNMRPLSQTNHPLETTITLESPKFINFLFFNFSLHTEHHVFPEANHTALPRVREILQSEYQGEYCSVPHGQAIRTFYSTPRAYLDEHHLFDPETDRKVDLIALQKNGFRPS